MLKNAKFVLKSSFQLSRTQSIVIIVMFSFLNIRKKLLEQIVLCNSSPLPLIYILCSNPRRKLYMEIATAYFF
jgi:hypothetical protein